MKVLDKAVSFQVTCPFCKARLEFETGDLKSVETEKGARDGILHCPECGGDFAVKDERGVYFSDVYPVYQSEIAHDIVGDEVEDVVEDEVEVESVVN